MRIELLLMGVFALAAWGCGDDGGGDATSATGSGGGDATTASGSGGGATTGAASGGGGSGSSCQEGDARVAVKIDGVLHETCAGTLSPGGLNHVFATFDDDYDLIVNFTGTVAASGVCVELGLREPGNDTTVNDWRTGGAAGSASGTCDTTVTAYGERVTGTFSGMVDFVTDASLGSRALTEGEFDVPGMP